MLKPAVCILASQPYGTLYIGVSSDLIERIRAHRSDLIEGFAKRYGVHRLVHSEQFDSMVAAIEGEKELKKWRRDWKIALIVESNPMWRDLWSDIGGSDGGG